MARWPQYTDDPVADHQAWCEHQDYLHGMLPMCAECGERIDSEFCYEINGEIICVTCMEQYKKFTADLME